MASKTMKKAKSVIAFIFLLVFWVCVAGAEYDLVMHLGILLSLFIGIFALSLLLDTLHRAPEGYEDENGFHIGVLAGAGLC
jgi:hypothetical protein